MAGDGLGVYRMLGWNADLTVTNKYGSDLKAVLIQSVAAAPHVQLGCVRRGPAPGHDAGVGLSPVPDEPAHWSQRTDTVVS